MLKYSDFRDFFRNRKDNHSKSDVKLLVRVSMFYLFAPYLVDSNLISLILTLIGMAIVFSMSVTHNHRERIKVGKNRYVKIGWLTLLFASNLNMSLSPDLVYIANQYTTQKVSGYGSGGVNVIINGGVQVMKHVSRAPEMIKLYFVGEVDSGLKYLGFTEDGYLKRLGCKIASGISDDYIKKRVDLTVKPEEATAKTISGITRNLVAVRLKEASEFNVILFSGKSDCPKI